MKRNQVGIIIKCVKYNYIKGFKYLCDNDLVEGNDKYIIEKYKLGLHQDEPLKDFEIWLSDIMNNLFIKKSNLNEHYIMYLKNDDILFSYLSNRKYLYLNKEKICWYISYQFKINNNLISMFIKDIFEKKLNLIIDDVHIIDNINMSL